MKLPGDPRMACLLQACIYKKWELLDVYLADIGFCKMADRRGLLPLHMVLKHEAPARIVAGAARCSSHPLHAPLAMPPSDGVI